MSLLISKKSLLELIIILIYIQFINYIIFSSFSLDNCFHIIMFFILPSLLTWLLFELFLSFIGKAMKYKIKLRFLYSVLIIPLGYIAFYSIIFIISLFIGIP